MKKVSLQTQAWVVVVGRGLTVLLSALCLFLWVSAALKPLLTVTAVSCFVMVMFELCVAWKLAGGNGEMVDERDRVLLSRAADKAIIISQMLIGIMTIVFLALAFKEKSLYGRRHHVRPHRDQPSISSEVLILPLSGGHR